jgi:arylsulfatase A-like enzyme
VKKYIHISIILIVIGLIACSPKSINQIPSKPNVLVVLLDDMGFSDLGCFGGEIETPTIDKLAENGLRFSNFHNNAKCHASRVSLLSGLYCHQAGNTSLRNATTIADVAKSKSYYTFATGKWHLQEHPMDRGFDRYFGHLAGATNYFSGVAMGNTGFSLDRDEFEIPEDFYSTNYIMDYSLEFIEEAIKKEKPFLGYTQWI